MAGNKQIKRSKKAEEAMARLEADALEFPTLSDFIDKIKTMVSELGVDLEDLDGVSWPPDTGVIKSVAAKLIRTAFDKMGLDDPFSGITENLPIDKIASFAENLPDMPDLPIEIPDLSFLKSIKG